MKLGETVLLAIAVRAAAAVLPPAGSQDQPAARLHMVTAQNASAVTAEITGIWLLREQGEVF